MKCDYCKTAPARYALSASGQLNRSYYACARHLSTAVEVEMRERAIDSLRVVKVGA